MPMNEESFIQLQITLAKIEERLRDVSEIKYQVDSIYNEMHKIAKEQVQNTERAEAQRNELTKLQERQQWLTRTVAGGIITAIVTALITIL